MKIARYSLGTETFWGVLDGDDLHRLAGAPWDGTERTVARDSLSDARLLAPVTAPRIFGVGLNYVAHIAESGMKTPEVPLLFMKPSTTVIGPEAPIVYPREAQNVHYECELAVVIGKTEHRIESVDAMSHVAGYTVANDYAIRTTLRTGTDPSCGRWQ